VRANLSGPDCRRGGITGGTILLHSSYDDRLVIASGLLATFAGYAILDLAARLSIVRGHSRFLWLIFGSIATGLAIGGAHCLGMLAFSLPGPIPYRHSDLIISLFAAIFAALVFLLTVSRPQLTARSYVVGGILTGSFIMVMHTAAMAAIVVPTDVTYPWQVHVVSFGFAILVSVFALLVAFRERSRTGFTIRRLFIAFLLGCGIHLLWLAVTFRAADAARPMQHVIQSGTRQILGVTLGALLLMLLGIITTLFDSARTQRALDRATRHDDVLFQTLAEAIPQIVWIADANGRTTYLNKRWYELSGTKQGEDLGEGWVRTIHPDDRAPCFEKWQKCMHSGEPFEIEYRLNEAVKGYRWYLDRAVPLRDEKGIIQHWFGTCTDIEEQKLYQQTLENQIKERTEELADANTRLQQEMWEKDLARRTLDEQNEKMLQAFQERSQRATLLAKMGELLQSCLTREEVFAAALGFAPKIFPSRRGAIALFNSSRSLVEVAGQWHDCRLPVMSFEAESCWGLRAGHPHLVVAGDNTARCAHAIGVTNTYLCIPILAQGEAIGILHVQATDEDPSLGEADLSFKTTFASQVGLSVANIGCGRL
jgi:PAS domain S-box-containing protein